MSRAEELKEQAALKALEEVKEGMLVGLGSGSTTAYFIAGLGHRIANEGLKVIGVPTSNAAHELGLAARVPMTELDPQRRLDVTVDGADEVDPQLNLIKGMGGALLREKVVAAHSRLHITVVDDSKLTEPLGTKGPLPVEVVTFGHTVTEAQLVDLGCQPELRLEADGKPFVTDNGNYIYHCTFPSGMKDPRATDRALLDLPGVVQTGLFLGLTHRVIVAGEKGVYEINEPAAGTSEA